MPRYANPLASPYPTDPAWGMAADSLATALFGDPEMRQQQQLHRARMEELAAQAERARAAAGYDTRRTETVTEQNARLFGDGPGSVAQVFADPQQRLAVQLHPEGLTLEQINKGQAGGYLNDLIRSRLPAPSGVAGAMVNAPQPTIINPDQPGYVDDGGGIVVETRKAPPAPPPPIDEQTLRLIGALQGDMPSETTAYTPEFSLKRQGNELGSAEKRSRIAADASVQGDRIRAGATVRSAQISAGATTYGQRLTDRRERGLGTFGPGRGDGQPKRRALTQADNNALRSEIVAQLPVLGKLTGPSANVNTLVLRRASDLLASGEAASPAEAVQRALQDQGVTYDTERNVVRFKNVAPGSDPLGIR